jgi:hypothetical protein
VDAIGNFYLAGTTQSNQTPVTPGAFQATFHGPTVGTENRGFVAKFSPVTGIGTGATLVYSTYLGGIDGTFVETDQVAGIVADADGNAYIAGNTTSYDFPVTIAAPTTCTATSVCQNVGYLTKLNPTGSALVWSTLVGANPTTCCGGAVAGMSPPRLDVQGNVYVSGLLTTAANGFPLVNPIQPPANAGGVFVTKYDPTGSTISFSTEIYSPSNIRVVAGGIDVDPQGNIYVAGNTAAGDLPVTAGAFQPAFAGGSGGASYDGFIAKINFDDQGDDALEHVGASHDGFIAKINPNHRRRRHRPK